jgi:hypothetical protein
MDTDKDVMPAFSSLLAFGRPLGCIVDSEPFESMRNRNRSFDDPCDAASTSRVSLISYPCSSVFICGQFLSDRTPRLLRNLACVG